MYGSFLGGDETGPGFAEMVDAVEGAVLQGDFPEAALDAGPAMGR